MKKLILIVFLLAGCTPKYVNPNLSEAQMQMDLINCKYEAESAGGGGMYLGAVHPLWALAAVGARVDSLTKLCMNKKGYTY